MNVDQMGMPAALRAGATAHAMLGLFARRVKRAEAHVAEWLARVERPYVAVSSGKDSTVILDLVRRQRAQTPAVYIDAECSFPETLEWLAATPNLLRFAADEPFLDTLARHGLEGGKALERATMQSTVWGPIKRLVATHGFDGVCYGLRAEESRERGLHAFTRGAVFRYQRDGLWACQPIWDWSYADVWAYIVSRGLRYCGVYDRMWDMPHEDQRLSYWAGETKRRHGRYAWLRRNYPDLYRQLVERVPGVRSYV